MARSQESSPSAHANNNIINSIPGSLPAELSGLEKIRHRLKPLLLYAVSTAQFLDIVNGASVAVALIPIADDLNFKVSQVLWIINAYTIAFAGLLLVSGRLGDLFGHRFLFLGGLIWFSTLSLIVSFSTTPLMFIISRAFQGVGAAGTIPTATALIAINYPAGPERTKAFSIYAGFGAMGAVTGILLAGGLIASVGWAWIFRISSIAGFVVLLVGFLSIPKPPPKSEKPKVDYLGATCTTLGVTGIVYYISTGVEEGWASPKTLPVFIISIALVASFVFIESKVDHPLMPLRIWKNRTFSASVATGFISFGMLQGFIYYVSMVFQEVYQWTAIQTALGFLVHALLAIVSFTVLGRVMSRLRLKPVILTGFVLRCVAALMFAFVTEHTLYWKIPFPALILHIIGTSCSFLPVQISAIRDAENKDQGLVGAIYNTALQLGAPFSLAILNVISISTNGNTNGKVRGGPVLMKGFKNAFFAVVAIGVVAFIIVFIIFPWDKPAQRSKKASAEDNDLEVGSTAGSGPAKETIVEEKVEFPEGSKLESDGASTVGSRAEGRESIKEAFKA
ncbi:hypothetical protein BGZ51_005952 [Haplosporangium sp. Z 767]|nr:hypothetical protein BGZ51_005952 [Haplosporangium sp. Z 767]KAF9196960.1 hypothetical protein BGZ50_004547 [Haplosporangium sp. Z 11]